MKRLIILILLPLFLSVQAAASLCSFQCDIQKNFFNEKSELSSEEHQSCHQKQESDKPSSTDSSDCASKVCQLDEILKSKDFELDINDLSVKAPEFSFYQITDRDNHNYALFIFSTGPPGKSFYSRVPLFILKSSYLI